MAKDIKFDYPESKKRDHIDDYFGTKISDPYRWLEKLDSDETRDWIKQQNNFTEDYLSKIKIRDKIKKRLTDMWNYPKSSIPFKKGNYYYQFKNEGLQNHSILIRKKDLDRKDETILDPNTFSDKGTSAISSLSFSHDNVYLAFGISDSGSEWSKIKILDLETVSDFNTNDG